RDDEGKAGREPNATQGVASVLEESAHVVRPRGAPTSPLVDSETRVANGCDGSEPPLGFRSRGRGVPSRRDKLLHQHLDVESQFVVDVAAKVGAEGPDVAAPART